MYSLKPYKRSSDLATRDLYDFYNLIDDFFQDKLNLGKFMSSDTFKMDVKDNDKEYQVEAELPGVKKEEISVDLTDGTLNISVKKEEKIDEEKESYIHKERRSSSMSRSIYLADAKTEEIKAKLDGGVLFITIPKEEKATSAKKIEIE